MSYPSHHAPASSASEAQPQRESTALTTERIPIAETPFLRDRRPNLTPPHSHTVVRSPDEETRDLQDTALSPLEQMAPHLAECAIDLTALALDARLDRAVGRDQELEAVVDILGKRRANNPVLVGPPGVGKTAIVEGLALAWAGLDPARPEAKCARRIVALDTGAVVAGTGVRGAFSERMAAIKAEVAQAQGQLIVFIDELHTLVGAGGAQESAQDAAQELKVALARGDFPCIGATTHDEFKRFIERDPALERRFTPVHVDEPDTSLALSIVQGAIEPYEKHHNLTYTTHALEAAVVLTERFITERKLPDKAFAVLDLAGSQARRRGQSLVDRQEIAAIVHTLSGVPVARLCERESELLEHAEQTLGERIVGHPHVVAAIAATLRRGFAGLNGRRPLGSLLFLGPSGVGKSEMVKALAELIFGRPDALVRFDMGEMAEQHAVARLLGAQPGYIGHEEGGQLTEAVRKRPFQVVLFDDIERAHPDVLALLHQLLDEGQLTDTQGRKVSFAHTIIVLTSGLGAECLAASTKPDIFQARDTALANDVEESGVLEAARRHLPSELWGRLDEHLVFLPLSHADIERIALRQLEDKGAQLERQRHVLLSFDSDVPSYLVDSAQSNAASGARSLRKIIQDLVDEPLARLILAGELEKPTTLHISVNRADDGLKLTAHAHLTSRQAQQTHWSRPSQRSL